MGDIETLGIIDEIQTLVNDKLQVVSYKWLSRNFLVSSNAAKRLLQDFVEKHGSDIEIIYSLCGWLKNNPSTYHIKLVSKSKLEEAKLDFNKDCSIQIYSVQACIPKDSSTLWNIEFVQAEELSKQALSLDNCLRDNRFGGVINSFVKRNSEGTPVKIEAPQVKAVVSGISKGNSVTLPKIQHSSPIVNPQPTNVKTESIIQNTKPAPEKEKVPNLPLNKKKAQTDKNSSGSTSSLANMWGRACVKPKPEKIATEIKISAEAEINANEGLEDVSSEDEGEKINMKRKINNESNRKRKIVIDYSDEEEDEYKDAVNLASPDPPKKQLILDTKHKISDIPKLETSFVEEDKPEVKVSKPEVKVTNPTIKEKSTKNEEKTSEKDKVIEAASKSPKRRKVVKTRIDERGREVNEVVWEGEEIKAKPEIDTKTENNTTKSAINRAVEIKKSPAIGISNKGGKGGNKKAGIKDPNQGGILSFFKKKG